MAVITQIYLVDKQFTVAVTGPQIQFSKKNKEQCIHAARLLLEAQKSYQEFKPTFAAEANPDITDGEVMSLIKKVAATREALATTSQKTGLLINCAINKL